MIPTEFISYKVYAKEQQNKDFTFIAEVDSIDIAGDLPSGCYDFYVTAFRSDSELESDPSNEVSVCAGNIGGSYNAAPKPPQNVRAM